MAEDVEFKAFCTKELNENEKSTYAKSEEKEDLEAKIEQLAVRIKRLTEEIDDAKKQTADTQVEIKKASQNREKENADFQTTVADQRATQGILKKALLRLGGLLQEGSGDAAPERSADTSSAMQQVQNNAGVFPVMGLIVQIIGDSEKLEKDETAGEEHC